MSAQITSVPKLIKSRESLLAWKNRYQERIKEGAERGMAVVSGVAGAMAAGGIRGMGYPVIPRTNLPTGLALGGLAAGAGMIGMGGKQSDALVSFGVGMAAPDLARFAEEQVTKWRGA